jgi:hypothetical protein
MEDKQKKNSGFFVMQADSCIPATWFGYSVN